MQPMQGGEENQSQQYQADDSPTRRPDYFGLPPPPAWWVVHQRPRLPVLPDQARVGQAPYTAGRALGVFFRCGSQPGRGAGDRRERRTRRSRGGSVGRPRGRRVLRTVHVDERPPTTSAGACDEDENTRDRWQFNEHEVDQNTQMCYGIQPLTGPGRGPFTRQPTIVPASKLRLAAATISLTRSHPPRPPYTTHSAFKAHCGRRRAIQHLLDRLETGQHVADNMKAHSSANDDNRGTRATIWARDPGAVQRYKCIPATRPLPDGLSRRHI